MKKHFKYFAHALIIVIFATIVMNILFTKEYNLLAFAETRNCGISNNSDFDEDDVLIVVATHILYDPHIKDYPRPIKIEPLFNLSNEIIAYDVTMSNGSYIIVNANKNNPIVLEFGESRLEFQNSNNKKFYLGPCIIAEKNDSESNYFKIINTQKLVYSQASEILRFQYVFETFCKTYNELLSDRHIATKKVLQKKSFSKNKDKFDFLLDANQLPNATYTEKLITSINYITPYGTTSEFDGINGVNNHCASTSAFNMVLYYRYRMGIPISSSDRNSVFSAIHSRIKNGPVNPTQYRNRIKKYIELDTSYNISVENISNTWNSYKNEIDNDRMNFMCIIPGIFDAHMINGVGYRIYPNGNYCVVLNNWYSQSKVYTIFGVALYNLSKIYIYN